MAFSIKEELRKFRRDVLGFSFKSHSNPLRIAEPHKKKCLSCKRVLPTNEVYFVGTHGGNLSAKCRRCQRDSQKK